MTLRKKLQTTLIVLVAVVLGLTAVMLWTTQQWQEWDSSLREHYERSLLLQEVRAGTFRAFKELPDAISRVDPDAREEFDALLAEAEKDFRSWMALAHTKDEQRQVEAVQTAFAGLIEQGHRVFGLVEEGRLSEAAHLLEDQIETVDFSWFESLSAEVADSDTTYRRLILRERERIRKLAQGAVVAESTATVGLVVLLGYYFVSRLFRPLGEVERALNALGSGDLERRIPEARAANSTRGGKDELTMLVQAFNRTVEELSRTTVSKTYLDSIIESMVDALVVTTPDGMIRTANPAAAALFGAAREQIVGKAVADFIPAIDLSRRGPSQDIETLIRTRDGRDVPVSLSRSAMRSGSGSELGSAFVVQDITDRKRAEEQIRAALEEKEVLFKEINHRVKNNLQVIDSLLSLQIRQIGDAQGREVLEESRHRIQAMALVHEMLYRSESPARIDFREYLNNLTAHLLHSYGAGARGIRIEARIAAASFGLDTAIPCGLIINELVTNSLKHAFPGERKGVIAVELQARAEGRYCLTVRDDGGGLPAGFRIEEARTLGLRLVRTLTEQIGGKLSVPGGPGACFEIPFSLPSHG